jgi:hypothetical protein
MSNRKYIKLEDDIREEIDLDIVKFAYDLYLEEKHELLYTFDAFYIFTDTYKPYYKIAIRKDKLFKLLSKSNL